jgi:predicted metal-dependent HD superfamily phosphohydrolase
MADNKYHSRKPRKPAIPCSKIHRRKVDYYRPAEQDSVRDLILDIVPEQYAENALTISERFSDLWRKLNAKGDPIQHLDTLISQYSENHRAYHNLNHIDMCLAEFDSAKQFSKMPETLELAIWYHDSVYDTKRKDNEEQSAALLRSMCRETQINPRTARKAESLILATKHDICPAEIDEKLIMDIDLSILGQSWSNFEHYDDAIRKEYIGDNPAIAEQIKFYNGRMQVLNYFLTRSQLYYTDFFMQKYDSSARKNLSRAVREISGKLEKLG